MITIRMSTVIARPVADVFAYVGDQTNAPRWQRGLLEVRRTTDGPIGVGTRHTVVRSFMGRRLELSNEYTRFEPDRLVEFRIEGSTPGRAGYAVEAGATQSSRLTTWMELRTSGPARLAEPLMAMMLRRDVEANLRTLRSVLEAESGSHQEHGVRLRPSSTHR